MSLYNLAGYVSAFFFALCLAGIWVQLRAVLKRKRDFPERRGVTSILSLNHFVVRFIAFLAIFLLGFTQGTFNPYLVYPYLPAVVLLLLIIREIADDRRDALSRAAFLLCSAALLFGVALWSFGDAAALRLGGDVANFVLICTSVLIAQSDAHQIYLIRRSGETGVVSLRTHQTTLMKDIATVLFALVMGFAVGWPIIASAGTSAVTKSLILYHFRWVRVSAAAERNRLAAATSPS